jgi:hypothetical protein
MSRGCTALAVGLVVALVLAGVGCGDDGTTTATTQPPETRQALPKLPKRWRAHVDPWIGYKIGIPPGWRVTRSRTGGVKAALIRSPDHLVAITLVAARDPDALEVPLKEFATRALAALPGFRAPLEPSPPRAFARTPFDAVRTEATGITKSRGLKERTTLLVLRREGIVNYTVAIVQNARRGYLGRERAVALKMLHTLRDQPVDPQARPKRDRRKRSAEARPKRDRQGSSSGRDARGRDRRSSGAP